MTPLCVRSAPGLTLSPLHFVVSTSAPDGPAIQFSIGDPSAWGEAGDRKSCCFCQHRLEPDFPNPPAKRSCRSQSVSSHQKPGVGGPRRSSIARPIALRLPQRTLYSPATNAPALSSTAHALVASGCVKLRNTAHQLRAQTSRLSWHHPIACTSNANRRPVAPPGLLNCSRHSVVYGGTTPELMTEVKLRKPPSLACLSSSASNSASDFSHQ